MAASTLASAAGTRDACLHEEPVEESGSLTCRHCGLVLQTQLFEDDWAPPNIHRKGSFYTWRAAVKTVLLRLGLTADPDAFPRPLDDAAVADAQRRLCVILRLTSLAAYVVLLRFPGCISTEAAREAGGATRREWATAEELLGAADLQGGSLRDERLMLGRLARQLQLPDAIADAALRALQEPRLECCDPKKLLVTLAAESIGEELAASLFGMSPEAVRRLRQRYQISAFAVDLSRQGRMLQLCVQRCRRQRRHDLDEFHGLLQRGFRQPWWHGVPSVVSEADAGEQEDEMLQPHLLRCTGCAARAQELGLSFLRSASE